MNGFEENMGGRITEGVVAIDDTLEMRARQIGEVGVQSYTLDLLRDPNEADKKFGSEVAEVLTAINTGRATETVEGEIADLLYASLVAARSRGKGVRLSAVLGELIARNQDKSGVPKVELAFV